MKEKETIKYADLPLISTLPEKPFQRARALMAELEKLGKVESRIEEIKQELEGIQEDYGRAGLRFGKLAFRSQEMAGRRTLKVEKLIEAGVKASLIEACYETGKAYTTKTFKVLD